MLQIDVGQNCKALLRVFVKIISWRSHQSPDPGSKLVGIDDKRMSHYSRVRPMLVQKVLLWQRHIYSAWSHGMTTQLLKLLLKQSTETAAHIEAFGEEIGLTKYDFPILSA